MKHLLQELRKKDDDLRKKDYELKQLMEKKDNELERLTKIITDKIDDVLQ